MTDNDQIIASCLAAFHAGDGAAKKYLISLTYERLREMTERLLRRFPLVGRRLEPEDVLHGAGDRLEQAVLSAHAETAGHFFSLAARHLRWQLIELAEKLRKERATTFTDMEGREEATGRVEAFLTSGPAKLDDMIEVGEQVEKLPEKERAVVDLLCFQGLGQDQAAAVLGVTTRTVKNRWRGAKALLREVMGDGTPPRKDVGLFGDG